MGKKGRPSGHTLSGGADDGRARRGNTTAVTAFDELELRCAEEEDSDKGDAADEDLEGALHAKLRELSAVAKFEAILPLPVSNVVGNIDEIQIGSVFDERYLIEKELGRGGMARVFKAQDTEAEGHPIVALKVLDYKMSRDGGASAIEVALERFKREVRALARLVDPRIVTVFEYAVSKGGLPYFTMEYCAGRVLGDILARLAEKGQGFSLDQTLDIAVQICEALGHAHAAGVVHRDLKPHNIMLTRSAEGGRIFVKILDFGIAKMREDMQVPRGYPNTGMLEALGTPQYMALELIHGKRDLDPRMDVHALGVTLYEMIAGVLPYSDANLFELADKKRFAPPSLRALRSDVPAELDDLIVRALSANPDERPASMREFADELTKISKTLTDNTATASAPTSERPKRRPRRRFDSVVLGIAASAAFTLVAADLVRRVFTWPETEAATEAGAKPPFALAPSVPSASRMPLEPAREVTARIEIPAPPLSAPSASETSSEPAPEATASRGEAPAPALQKAPPPEDLRATPAPLPPKTASAASERVVCKREEGLSYCLALSVNPSATFPGEVWERFRDLAPEREAP